jgi:hypothetical protein
MSLVVEEVIADQEPMVTDYDDPVEIMQTEEA